MLCPPQKLQPNQIEQSDVDMITKDRAKLAEIRSRLSDVYWWMRLLNQTVAQRANREDDEVGKFGPRSQAFIWAGWVTTFVATPTFHSALAFASTVTADVQMTRQSFFRRHALQV